MPVEIAEAAIEDFPVEISGETVKHPSHLGKHRADLLHVPARERVRQTGSRRNLSHVIVRRLGRLTEWQHVVEKMISPALANLDELSGREFCQRGASACLIAQVATN